MDDLPLAARSNLSFFNGGNLCSVMTEVYSMGLLVRYRFCASGRWSETSRIFLEPDAGRHEKCGAVLERSCKDTA